MFLTEVQLAVTRLLNAHPFFKGSGDEKPISVIASNDKSLWSRADMAMQKLGLCVIVVPLGGDTGPGNLPTVMMQPARFTCRVRENQLINRASSGTGQPADYVAEICAYLLHQAVPRTEDGTALGGGGIVIKGLSAGEDDKGITAWDCVFEYEGGLSHEPVRRDFASKLPGGI